MKALILNHRYQLVSLLGEGGEGSVYSAFDQQLDQEIAIKIIHGRPAASERLRSEFLRLSAIEHPGLVRVFNIDRVTHSTDPSFDSGLFFTAENLNGETLDRWISHWRQAQKGQEQLDIRTVLARIVEIAQALAALHQAGLVHRDIKPSNVIVAPRGAVVLDLGLSGTGTKSTGPRGTLRYMNGNALIGQADEQSDIFALGSTLYYLLGDEPPYPGASATEHAKALSTATPTPLLDHNPKLPPVFTELVDRMVSQRECPRSANALLHQLSSVYEALGLSHDNHPAWPPPSRYQRRWFGDPATVDQLTAAIRLTAAERPALVRVLSTPQLNPEPLIDAAVNAAQLAAVSSGSRLEVLDAHSMRSLESILAKTKIREIDELRGHARIAATTDAILVELANRGRAHPVLVILARNLAQLAQEERAWDPDSTTTMPMSVSAPQHPRWLAELEAALVSGDPTLAKVPVTLLMVTPANAHANTNTPAFADKAGWVTDLVLSPMSLEEAARLAADLHIDPPGGHAWLDALNRAVGGNRLAFANALTRALQSIESIESIDPGQFVSLPDSQNLRLYYAEQAKKLPTEFRDLVGVAAIFDSPVTFDQLAHVLDCDKPTVHHAVANLSDWLSIDDTDRIQLCSLAQRDGAEDALTTKQRRHWHQRVAATDIYRSPGQYATHLTITGPRSEVCAARQAAAKHHLCRGELNLAKKHALLALDWAAGKEITHTRWLVAEIEFQRSEYHSAIEHAQVAARSRNHEISTRAHLLIARALRRSGDRAGATAALTQMIKRIHPSSRKDHRIHGELARLLVYSANYRDALATTGTVAALLRASDGNGIEQSLEAAGLAELYLGNPESAKTAFDRIGELAAEREDRELGGRAHALAGLAAHHRGDIARAAKSYAQASRLARQAGRLHAAATADINQASALAERGHFSAALVALDAATIVLRRIGNVGELVAALYNRAYCLFQLGDLTAAQSTAERALETSRLHNNPQFEMFANLVLGDVARRQGSTKLAHRYYQSASQVGIAIGLDVDHVIVLAHQAELAAELGSAKLAIEQIEQAEKDGHWPHRVLLSRARVCLRLQLDSTKLSTALDNALDATQRSGRDELAWRLAAMAARVAAAFGERPRARARARLALEIHRAIVAATPDSRKSALLEDPDVVALASLVEDLELSTAIRAPVSEPRARPFDLEPEVLKRLLSMSRRLNSELHLEPLLDQVLDTAIELAGAERGFVLLRQRRTSDLEIVAARNIDHTELIDPEKALSQSIARRAARSGETVLAIDAAFDERFDTSKSVADMKLRSVLAVPLRCRRDLIGAIYLDHRVQADAFDERSTRLTQELAHIAGVALGNARLNEQIHDRAERISELNERLETELSDRETELALARSQVEPHRLETSLAKTLIGSSTPMRELRALIERVATNSLAVVISGESGSGKELVARAIHRHSSRRNGPLVTINCGAIAETLLESELFGHARGAFTGADRERRGFFEVANGGTLFLDEIADTSPAMQAKLLRVIQERELRRLGDETVRPVDVRIIAATHQNLDEQVAAGKFRQDLYFRINVLQVRVPPLRERLADVGELARHLLIRDDRGQLTPQLSPETLSALAAYRWPGNVRELDNELARAAALATGMIEPHHLSARVLSAADSGSETPRSLREQVEALERELIIRALQDCDGNQTKAAIQLGLSRYGLHKKLKRYQLEI